MSAILVISRHFRRELCDEARDCRQRWRVPLDRRQSGAERGYRYFQPRDPFFDGMSEMRWPSSHL